ncbi:hypothetical protein KDW_07400 [Dictyobacter vulcani]|uniref:Uncharacterized protein n=1 Tax=Dictyobacter vulcani TaxID=2607529 RepID=A0A5J4KCR4_9CHLR|nr:hypothetical protein [Dictyobacter vulcani]GER86578.1 hypothetical protein KDW_07400 [Dictyobacter vulcani]
MRTDEDIYWSTSLPKDHEALQALDAFCKEWGGLTRSEATRRILIEWEKIRIGKDVSAWGPNASARLAASVPSERAPRMPGSAQKPHIPSQAAKAASQVLDD